MPWILICALLALPARADTDEDDDGDGWGESDGDCDDGDATTWPGAPETCDGADNDCDGVSDEGTECFDDDSDGFTEEAGDCDDTDPNAYPGGFERVNDIDDDCDGVIDNDTVIFDDDGDGVSEVDGDCDDADATRSPNLTDWCRDQLDQDCSGIADDDCVENPSDGCDPDISVTLSVSSFSAPAGSQIEVEAHALYLDSGLEPAFSWEVDDGTIEGTGASVTWLLPDRADVLDLRVTVSDACSNIASDDAEVISMLVESADSSGEVDTQGCGGDKALVFFGLFGLFGLRRRR